MSAARIGGKGRGACGLLSVALALAAAGPAGAGAPRRAVVLAPSAAEIVAALGVADRLVGVCQQCDYPPAALAGLRRVGSYVTPSLEAVVALRPDLVVAVPSPGNREVVREIERLGVPTLVVGDRTLADLWEAVGRIARRFEVPDRGERLVARIRQGLGSVRAAVEGRPRPTVLLVVGHRPLVVAGAGTLQDELLDVAGAENLGRRLGGAWPTLSLETVAREAPAVIVDAAMGSEAGLRALLPPPPEGQAAARVVRVPVDALVRAGPRVVDAARLLARELHPEALP